MLWIMSRPQQRPGDRVYADLRARLESGEWTSGAQLPTVRDLAEHYGVAVRTVSRVLSRLAADGLVTVVPGWGTFRP
jgi:GntR family transcriptional regulator